MQVDGNRIFRVKDLAELLDVHQATVYRAIESGALDALKIGTGRGTLRIPGNAVNIWLSDCGDAAYTSYVEGNESPAAADDSTETSTDNQASTETAEVA